MVKDCVVTPCGHSFCRSCAGDAVTRKHTCPVCQVGIIGGEAGLIRNFLVDEVTQALSESTEETDVAYMRLLFEKAADHGKRGRSHGEIEEQTKYYSGDSKSSPSQPQQNLLRQVDTSEAGRSPATEITASSEIGALSPIETVLVTRMREAFLGYQAYYAREQAEHKEEVRSLVAQLNTPQVAAREDEECGRDTGERKATAILAAIEESKARFEAGMKALLKDFDAHAAAAVPPPSLLPTTTTVIVASRSVRFDTQLLPTHFTENIYGKVRKGCDLQVVIRLRTMRVMWFYSMREQRKRIGQTATVLKILCRVLIRCDVTGIYLVLRFAARTKGDIYRRV